ncbi:MAG: thiol:disulfide interchange protein DsbC [Gammaproteobacteria bacterium]|jgi:thiol:disulfide interchange protein DsbC
MKLVILAVATILSVSSITASAESELNKRLTASIQKVLKDAEVTSIAPSPIPGMYEVMIGPSALYISEDGRYVVKGEVFDIESLENLTKARQARARADSFKNLNAQDMIEFSPLKGKALRTLYVYTDIDCGYCRKLHTEVNQLTEAGITVKYLAYPRSGLKGESYDKAVSVWCAGDRQKALTDSKAGQVVKSATCENPVKDHFRMGEAMGIRGTPAVFSDDGEQFGGYVPAKDLIRMLTDRDS